MYSSREQTAVCISLPLLKTGGAETGQMEQSQTNHVRACVHHGVAKNAKEPLSNPCAAGSAVV